MAQMLIRRNSIYCQSVKRLGGFDFYRDRPLILIKKKIWPDSVTLNQINQMDQSEHLKYNQSIFLDL